MHSPNHSFFLKLATNPVTGFMTPVKYYLEISLNMKCRNYEILSESYEIIIIMI